MNRFSPFLYHRKEFGMKQKISALIFALILLTGITGCGSQGQQSTASQTASGALILSASSAAEGQPEADENSKADASSSETAFQLPSKQNTSSAASTQTVSSGGKVILVSEEATSSQASGNTSQQLPVTSTQIPEALPTAHQAVKKSDYYGYQQLSASQKKIYDQIDTAVYSLQNDVSVFGTWESVQKVFGYYWADHPQCFWLDRTLCGSYNGSNYTLHLSYLDGNKADTFDIDARKWTGFSDHKKIESQITAYQKHIAAVVNEISPALTVLEKEKKIHDCILRRVTYPNPIPDESHLYTSYGALIKQEGVCEGYAKLFQHLCYEVGINCLQVIGYGTTDGRKEAHMWNIVELDGAWYQTDVTWDDAYNDNNVLSYRYFNLTDRQMGIDHTIEADGSGIPTYPAPACTATKYHYYTNYCVNITKSGKLSADAAERIKWALELGDSYLYIVFPEGYPSNDAINKYLYGKQNSVLSALKAEKPGRTLQMTYIKLEESCIMVKVK